MGLPVTKDKSPERKRVKMYKKLLTFGVAALAAVVFSGCSALQTADKNDFNGMDVTTSGTPVAHISATTHGLYLLWIPLVTGSTSQIGMPALLEDTVNAATLTDMITGKAKEMGGERVIDLVTQSSSQGFLFKYCQATASGTVIK